MKRLFLAALSILFLMISCNEKDLPAPYGQFSNSVFVINEGPFQAGTGTISAFNRETGEVTPDLFEMANGRPLGNIVQSLTVHGDKAYIVVNKSNKIEVVNLEDFTSVATIENITLPRYFIGLDEHKGYVSCWDSTVKVINLADYSIINSIPAGNGPDEMLLSGEFLFVINSGGFGTDSAVFVFTTITDEPAGSFTVGLTPAGIQKDMHGNIWVLCSGKGWNGFPSPGDTPARLVCFDPDSHEILNEMAFPDNENHPDNLIINGDGSILFYNHPAGIFSFPVSSPSLNEQPMINSNNMFYGLGFDAKEKMIYATDPIDNAQNGWVYRFNESDGNPVDSFMVGIFPNGFWFN